MTEIAWKLNKREKKSSDLDLLNLATNCTVITKQKTLCKFIESCYYKYRIFVFALLQFVCVYGKCVRLFNWSS